MSAGYSTREVAKLVNLPERRIRAYARAGLVGRNDEAALEAGPRRSLRFDFRDLLVLRMAARLLSEGLPPIRVQKALAALRRQIAEQPLSGTQLYHEDGCVVARSGGSTWHPESGQFLLRFAAKRVPETPPQVPLPLRRVADAAQMLAEANATPAPPSAEDANAANADTWFDMALELEETEPQRAYELYLRALAADPEHVEATINVGRLCSASGDSRRAAAYFRQATRMDSAHPVAHFNLAVTLHDLSDLTGAAEAYRVALLHDPHFADAHYNLATLLEQQGDAEEAFRHFQAYRSVCRDPV